MDCNPPGSSVRGILQARILEWVASPFSRGSSWPRNRTHISCTAGGFFTTEPTEKPSDSCTAGSLCSQHSLPKGLGLPVALRRRGEAARLWAQHRQPPPWRPGPSLGADRGVMSPVWGQPLLIQGLGGPGHSLGEDGWEWMHFTKWVNAYPHLTTKLTGSHAGTHLPSTLSAQQGPSWGKLGVTDPAGPFPPESWLGEA